MSEDTKPQAVPAPSPAPVEIHNITGASDAPAEDTSGNETVSGIQPEAQRKAMEELPPNHTYRDRVEAQAKALGIKVEDGWTLERLMFEIRMQASS